jgi:5-methylcytosine-specific restriction protein A
VSRQREARRPSASARGYGGRWRKARAGYLRKHPLCVTCQAEGRTEPATVVDHIVDHKGDRALFWDRDNWQALCKACHDRKTATENRFGRGDRGEG